jgi:hypothetical protein
MYCLHCGDCCLRMSPISAPEPCPKIKQDGDFFFCGDYKNRPEECAKHDFPSRFCPVGMMKLNLLTPDEVRSRIDTGYDKCINL